MRVRLINAFTARIARLDVPRMAAVGALDDDFGNVKTATTSDGRRVLERREKPAVAVRCQVEDQSFKSLRMADAGNTPEAKLGLVVEWHWLEANNLIDQATGLPLFQVNDRLVSIADRRGRTVHAVPAPAGGLYCVEVRPIAYGIGRRLELMLLRFNDRAQGQNT